MTRRRTRIGGARAEREDPKLVGAFNGSRVISSKFRFLISIKAEARFAGYITRDDCSAPVRGADPLRQKRAHAQRPASRADRRLDPRISHQTRRSAGLCLYPWRRLAQRPFEGFRDPGRAAPRRRCALCRARLRLGSGCWRQSNGARRPGPPRDRLRIPVRPVSTRLKEGRGAVCRLHYPPDMIMSSTRPVTKRSPARRYSRAEAWREPAFIDGGHAATVHGNRVSSIVIHGHEWNGNLPLPELYCRIGVVQVIARSNVRVTHDPVRLISYLDGVMGRHPETR